MAYTYVQHRPLTKTAFKRQQITNRPLGRNPPSPRCQISTNEVQTTQQESLEKFSGLKVFVAGATGGTGECVVKNLLEKKVETVAFVRDVQKAQKLFPTSEYLTVIEGDIQQYASIPPAMEGCNVVVSALGISDFNILSPFLVDFQGVANVAACAKNLGAEKIVCVSSIGADEIITPLNLFGGVLFWKKRGEEAVQRSGIDYTIVRPGGLRNELKSGEQPRNIVMKKANTYGFEPGKIRTPKAILRSQVADVVVEALVSENARNKVVEIVTDEGAPMISIEDQFQMV
eukprot:TRINITY_DN6663_c0_g1_i2.p2 TRINITY_DN6663_c0_g1~~TRINITY_DN6663_c0_g1_i2.p2  ORF type:complete len:311 (+),score=32.92 TRINITY_DN6663_c0_g1_i2:74-934(+)